MGSAINWFEIPVSDLGRAAAFYERVLGRPLRRMEFMGVGYAFLPYDQPGVGGGLVERGYVGGYQAEPALGGAVVYLNVDGRLDEALAAAVAAGGQVIAPATTIATDGRIALIIDSEGNRVGLNESPR